MRLEEKDAVAEPLNQHVGIFPCCGGPKALHFSATNSGPISPQCPAGLRAPAGTAADWRLGALCARLRLLPFFVHDGFPRLLRPDHSVGRGLPPAATSISTGARHLSWILSWPNPPWPRCFPWSWCQELSEENAMPFESNPYLRRRDSVVEKHRTARVSMVFIPRYGFTLARPMTLGGLTPCRYPIRKLVSADI